jgi:polyhydroxyalkanoate synthesis repressor PhaR
MPKPKSKPKSVNPTDSETQELPGSESPAQRVIKKYPNRRLYDTRTSSYITLAEIKQLVMNSEPFSVVDAKTAEDISRSILLQIILEEEAGGSPMFTAPVLENIIRFYGNTMQGFMGGYLEKNMQSLMDLQRSVIPAALATPLAPLGNNVFLQMQEHMQKQTEQFLSTFAPKR